MNSPDILCSPTNFSDIYFGGVRNLPLVPAAGGIVEPDVSDNSNEASSMQVRLLLLSIALKKVSHSKVPFLLLTQLCQYSFKLYSQEWSLNMPPSNASRQLQSKYAPLTNITPTQSYLQHNFIYRPSWESSNSSGKSLNKKNKFGGTLNNKGGLSFSKMKSKNKHRFVAGPITNKSDGSKSKRSTGFDFPIKKEGDSKGGRNKYDSRHMHIKEEPTSDIEIRNESESDTDSDTDKKKSSKKSHDKNSSKKGDKGQKSRKSGQNEDCSLYDNNGNSDDNSNDFGQHFDTMKSNLYQKSNIKSEAGGSNENAIQRGDGSGQTTSNLDKSSSSVEEFDNEKPTKVVKVHINLEYDSEVYNEEVHIRKFHKYQRNVEMANNCQVAPFDSNTESFPFESNACGGPILENVPQISYSSSDSDSDDSDGNDLYDSENSSCDECNSGPCSNSVLPSLQNGDTASSPAMSLSSYYNKNGKRARNLRFLCGLKKLEQNQIILKTIKN